MASDIIRKIEDLIEGIDEFNEKYVTYNAKVLRIVLVETIDYIKQKDRALNEIENFCRNEGCSPCKELEEDFYCDECHNKIILDIINKAKKK